MEITLTGCDMRCACLLDLSQTSSWQLTAKDISIMVAYQLRYMLPKFDVNAAICKAKALQLERRA